MVLFNYSTKELTAKVVYYGPGLCGKTTNLQYVHANLPGTVKGKMLSLATKTDRTLFFDFLPLDLGTIRGMKTRIQLYTVPGQVFYNETRKLVLKGADGIVFVADSQEQMLQANVESFRNLEENLKAHGMTLGEMPHVLQFNKRDLPKIASIEDMNSAINKFNAPFYETVATTGIGVQDTLKAITKLVLLHLTTKYDPKANARRAATPTVAPAVAPPPPAADPAPVSPAAAEPVVSGAAGIPLSAADPVQPAVETPVADPQPVETTPDHGTAGGPPPPPNFHGDGPGDDVPRAPSFDDDEIEHLMDEVDDPAAKVPDVAEPVLHPFPIPDADRPASVDPEESVEEVGESTFEMPAPEVGWDAPPEIERSPAASAGTPAEGDLAVDELAAPETGTVAPIELPDADPIPDTGPSSETEEPTWNADDAPSIGVEDDRDRAPVPLAADGEGDRASFELDSSFDPEWDHPSASDGEGLQTARTDAADPPPAVLFDPPADLDETPDDLEGDVHAADDAPLELTEVADDDHSLFEDPTLDVARLASGHAKEIVVPVELGEGSEMRRFKLSVTLKLDPVD